MCQRSARPNSKSYNYMPARLYDMTRALSSFRRMPGCRQCSRRNHVPMGTLGIHWKRRRAVQRCSSATSSAIQFQFLSSCYHDAHSEPHLYHSGRAADPAIADQAEFLRYGAAARARLGTQAGAGPLQVRWMSNSILRLQASWRTPAALVSREVVAGQCAKQAKLGRVMTIGTERGRLLRTSTGRQPMRSLRRVLSAEN